MGVGGRPSKYKPEYCKELIDHMSKGYSFETFGPAIGVATGTTYRWLTDQENDSPETLENKRAFREAKKIAVDRSRLFWERIGIEGAVGDIQGFNVTAWIFNMKNRFSWRDRVETTGEVSVKPYVIERPNGDSVELGVEKSGSGGKSEDHS